MSVRNLIEGTFVSINTGPITASNISANSISCASAPVNPTDVMRLQDGSQNPNIVTVPGYWINAGHSNLSNIYYQKNGNIITMYYSEPNNVNLASGDSFLLLAFSNPLPAEAIPSDTRYMPVFYKVASNVTMIAAYMTIDISGNIWIYNLDQTAFSYIVGVNNKM